MDEKQIKALTDQIQAEIKKFNEASAALETLKKQMDGKASADQVAELVNKANAGEVSIKKLSEQLDAIQLEMKDHPIGKPVSLFGEMEKWYKNNKDKVVQKGKTVSGSQIVFELKDIDPRSLLKASTIDTYTELADSSMATAVVVPMRVAGVEKLPDRQVMMLDVVGRGVTASNRVTWVERTARTAAAASVAEGAQYAQSDMTYSMYSAEVEKIGTHLKVTNEALEDWDEMLTQIKNELFPMVERILEDELYEGTGTTPHLDGIITTASAYSSTSLTNKITAANNFDAIRAACNQIAEYNYIPNAAFVTPAEFAMMEMTKDKNGQYVMPPFVTASGMNVAGIRIYPSNLIGAGKVLVGDFSKVTLYIKRGIEVKIWDQDSTDPEYDLKTVTASVRAAVKFPTAHIYAFVYDDLTDIMSDITAA
jgi:HK97 family phage major capsid protein